MPRFRLLLVLLIAAVQVVTVSGALMLQNRVAEQAMIDRGGERLSATARQAQAAIHGRVEPFVEGTSDLVERLRAQAFPKGATEQRGATEMAIHLLGAITKSADVEAASLTIGRTVIQIRRGGPTGFRIVSGIGSVGLAQDMHADERGELVLQDASPAAILDVARQPWYRRVVSGDAVVAAVLPESGALVAARRVRVGDRWGVAWLISRPGLLSEAVAPAASPGVRVAVLPDGSRPRWALVSQGMVPGSDLAVLDRLLDEDERSPAGTVTHPVSAHHLLRTSALGDDDLVWAVPYRTGDLAGHVVAVASVGMLTEGAGSVITSTWLALLAGVAAGALVLPLIFRATRRVDAMHRTATLDALTGLANRVELGHRGPRILRQHRRRRHTAIVAVMDLDGFKNINDTHGHQTGDEVLQAFAGRLLGAVREGDLVARIGGDEFVVIVGDQGDGDPRRMVQRLLRDCSRRPISTSTGNHHAVCTIGYAEDTGHESLVQLIGRADAALIAGKVTGKGAVYRAPDPVDVPQALATR